MRSHLIKPLLDGSYPVAVFGKGVFIYDDKGKRYLDGCSGAVTASIGHGVREIIEAMEKQAKKISFVYRSQFTTEEGEELADALSSLPFIKDDEYCSFFVNSGSEAMETAMKIAIQYWQEQGKAEKNKIISRWTSYHGITMGALTISGHSERRRRFVSWLDEYAIISPPYCFRCPFQKTYPECQLLCATELENAIQRIGADSIAAFAAEPIVGAAGTVIVPPEGYYEKIKEICDRYEILFIADEVMTGIGRCGKYFAMEYWGVKPDIIALGKGLSAGYAPFAATMASGKVMEAFYNGSRSIMSGHTYSANPQSAAVALAVLRYVQKHRLEEKAGENGNDLLNALKSLTSKYSFIGDVRGKGMLIGIEFVADRSTNLPFPRKIDFTNMVVSAAKEKGLLLYPAAAGIEGGDGDGVIVAPPLNINKEEMEQLLDLFKKTMDETERQLDGIGSTT